MHPKVTVFEHKQSGKKFEHVLGVFHECTELLKTVVSRSQTAGLLINRDEMNNAVLSFLTI